MKYEFSYIDLWPYLMIAFVFIFCYVSKVKNSPKIIYFILLLFCTLRYDVGWDYTSYVFEIENGYSDLLTSRFEPLSKIILVVSSVINFFPLTFIIFSLLTLRLTFISIKRYSISPIISWVVFYSMPLFFFASLSTIRQSLATVIILYSYKFAKDKRYLLFTISIFIASLFHLSAIMGFLILPLILLPINKTLNYILFASSFVLSSYIKNTILPYFLDIHSLAGIQRYIDIDTAGPTTLQYLYYVIALFNLIFYDRLVRLNSSNIHLITITTFGVVIFNILSFEPISAARISAFYLIFWIYLFPYYGRLISIKYSKYIEFSIVVFFIILSFYYLFMYIQAYENNVLEKISFLPYKFWWFNL